MARVEIGQHLGMSPASVSDLTASLLDEGILVTEEAGDQALRPDPGTPEGAPVLRRHPRRGDRRAGPASTASSSGSSTAPGRNRASRRVERPLRNLEAEELMDVLADTIATFARDMARPNVKAIGLACQGYVDTREGIVAWSPVLGARDLPLASGLSQRLGKPVLIENDASAMAFAIAQREPGPAVGRTACLMVGDGVGLGFLIQGELYRGRALRRQRVRPCAPAPERAAMPLRRTRLHRGLPGRLRPAPGRAAHRPPPRPDGADARARTP